ncbi:MAG: hypothetical protein AAGU32_05770 [Bacillota bacterium]
MKRTSRFLTLALAIILIMSCVAIPASAMNCADNQSTTDMNAVARAPEYLKVKSGYTTEIFATASVSPNYKWLKSGDEMYVISYYIDSLNYFWVYGRVSKGDLYGEYGWVIYDSNKVTIIQT